MYNWEAYELNNGSLLLAVLDGETPVFVGAGYEFRPGDMKRDIDALGSGSDPRDWDGNELEANRDIYLDLVEDPAYNMVAADGRIWIEDMGYAARREFLHDKQVSFSYDGRHYINDLSCLEHWMNEHGAEEIDILRNVEIGGLSAGDMCAGDLLEIM